MEQYFMIAVIVLWFAYSLVIKLTKKRKYDYSIIFAFVFLLAYGYFYIYGKTNELYYAYFEYGSLLFFVIWIIIDNFFLLKNQNHSDDEFTRVKRELQNVNESSELLRRRFISTIELFENGISFRDENYIFGTDKFIEIIGVESNEFTIEDFEKRIQKEDLIEYKNILLKLTKKYPNYSIKYRVNYNGKIRWIIERGQLLLVDKKRTYVTNVKVMDVRQFPTSDVDVLNNIPMYREMEQEMQRLSRLKKGYHFIIINLTNIPKINEKFGRDFGDLMMGEYLSKLRFKFIKDSQSLFRISGVKFGLIIKDKSKFELLSRALVGQGELFTMNMKFGGVSQTIYPNLGISESPYTGKNVSQVIEEAEKALEITYKNNYDQSFYFYKG